MPSRDGPYKSNRLQEELSNKSWDKWRLIVALRQWLVGRNSDHLDMRMQTDDEHKIKPCLEKGKGSDGG